MANKKPTKPYVSMAHAIRMVQEAKTARAPAGGPEKDMNDQISVGTYTTKAFEMSDKAQKLYSNLPKDTNVIAAENVAVLLDRMFALQKACEVRGKASEADLMAIDQQTEKALKGAEDMGQLAAVKDIIADVSKAMGKHEAPERVIEPEDHKHPSEDPRFATSAKDYSTDRKNDRDIDNVKSFLLARNKKAQQKLKIIDDQVSINTSENQGLIAESVMLDLSESVSSHVIVGLSNDLTRPVGNIKDTLTTYGAEYHSVDDKFTNFKVPAKNVDNFRSRMKSVHNVHSAIITE